MKNNFANDVVEGLTSKNKYLSSKYFYDDTGSRIFQEIMNMPEYYLTDSEFEILSLQAKQIIDARLLPILKDGVAVFIESHTDMRGQKKDNQNLSDRRAKAVTDYLISRGINVSQLYAKGFGESRLLNKCSNDVACTESEHSINRRTTFRVVNQN